MGFIEGKGKGRFFGVYLALRLCMPIVPSPPENFLPSPLEVPCISNTQRTLLVKEGTMKFGQQFPKRAGFFFMPHSWDTGQIILLPLRRKACCGFFQSEKSDGFGREQTHDLGYQRPAC
jgi:hypothetical protein